MSLGSPQLADQLYWEQLVCRAVARNLLAVYDHASHSAATPVCTQTLTVLGQCFTRLLLHSLAPARTTGGLLFPRALCVQRRELQRATGPSSPLVAGQRQHRV